MWKIILTFPCVTVVVVVVVCVCVTNECHECVWRKYENIPETAEFLYTYAQKWRERERDGYNSWKRELCQTELDINTLIDPSSKVRSNVGRKNQFENLVDQLSQQKLFFAFRQIAKRKFWKVCQSLCKDFRLIFWKVMCITQNIYWFWKLKLYWGSPK